jgi:hypothetical protein
LLEVKDFDWTIDEAFLYVDYPPDIRTPDKLLGLETRARKQASSKLM